MKVINYDIEYDEDWIKPPEPTFTINKKLEWRPYSASGTRLRKSEYRDLLLEQLSSKPGHILKYSTSIFITVKKNIKGIKLFPWINLNRKEIHILECEHDGKYLKIVEKFDYKGHNYGCKKDIKELDLKQSEDYIIEKYKEKYIYI